MKVNKAMDGHPDYLRSPESVCKPDIRSSKASFLSDQPVTVADQYADVVGLTLHNGVPEDIQIQFETTKNLYLYAWFVYRFYPVVEHHVYACLELALRERFEQEMISEEKDKRGFGPGLKQLLAYAVKNGYLKNENFSVWQHRTKMRAQQRYRDEIWEEAQRKGLNEISYDDTQYEIKDVDRDHDYLEQIINTLPPLRNHYAHGSTSLDKQVLGTIKLVSEMINQIYTELK